MATARTKGNFQFVDGLTQLTDYAAPNKEYLAKPAEPKPSSTTTTATPSSTKTTTTTTGARIARPAAAAATPPAPPKVLSYSPKLVDLYRALEEITQDAASKTTGPSQKQLILILDDLSVLLNCGWPCRDVLALVRYLKLLVAKVIIIPMGVLSLTIYLENVNVLSHLRMRTNRLGTFTFDIDSSMAR